jgi:uncharacterized membrane protein YcjF (UPF0283 family)
MEQSRKSKKNKKLIVIAVVAVVLAGLVAMLILQRVEINRLNDPTATAEQSKAEAAKLKEKVGQLAQLPDEEATVATVQDAEKLRDQEFFKNAQNGDKVLIFTNDKKAFIYRESENKVINSGPIVLNSGNLTE